jgi:hypothetical protein
VLYSGRPQLDRWLADQIGFEANIVQVVVQEFTSSAVAGVAATIDGLQAATYLSTESSKQSKVQVVFKGDEQVKILGLGFLVGY